MKSAVAPAVLAIVAGLAVAPVPAQAQAGAAQAGTVPLASHRAVYDLKLAQSRGKRPMSAVRGRILYDFSGNACEGYALQFRQVSQLDSGEGKVALSDLRATSWEEGAAKRLRFHSENFLNEQLRDAVRGFEDDGRPFTFCNDIEESTTISSFAWQEPEKHIAVGWDA